MIAKLKRRWVAVSCILGAGVLAVAYYVWAHPLVFNESFFEHAHCIKQAGTELRLYAADHDGRFPFHTNGYGDALLLMTDAWLPSLTGPGYDTRAFERARKTGTDVSEKTCGRVYVQGLSETNSPEIALLFDKLPSPGDHRHGLARLAAPLVREVLLLDGSMEIIRESDWPAFARRQIALLVKAGIPIPEAEGYYAATKNK